MQKSRVLSSLKQLEGQAAPAPRVPESSRGDLWEPFPLAKACRPQFAMVLFPARVTH